MTDRKPQMQKRGYPVKEKYQENVARPIHKQIPYLAWYTKINFKLIIELNVSAQTIKLSEEKVGQIFVTFR